MITKPGSGESAAADVFGEKRRVVQGHASQSRAHKQTTGSNGLARSACGDRDRGCAVCHGRSAHRDGAVAAARQLASRRSRRCRRRTADRRRASDCLQPPARRPRAGMRRRSVGHRADRTAVRVDRRRLQPVRADLFLRTRPCGRVSAAGQADPRVGRRPGGLPGASGLRGRPHGVWSGGGCRDRPGPA